MKKLTFLIALIVLSLMTFGQGNTFRYPITIGMGAPGTVTGGSVILKGLTSGTATIRVPAVAGTGTIFQLPANNGTNNYVLKTDGSGNTSWVAQTGGISASDTASMLTPYVNRADTADMLSGYLRSSNTETGSAYYVLHAPDTVQHTSNYTVAASDWRKDQHCLKATSIVITVPQNLSDWPVGGVMNFYGEGAGIMVFKKGTSVVFISDKDSIATSRKGQAVSIKKIATNKYFLLGPLTD